MRFTTKLVALLALGIAGTPTVGAQPLVPIEIDTVVTEGDSKDDGLTADSEASSPVVVELRLTGEGNLTGLGLCLHFDQTALTWSAMEYVHRAGLVGYQLRPDVNDTDGDPTTNTCLSVAWMDSGARWPGDSATPQVLLRARFTRTGPGDTPLRVTSPTLPPGRSFSESRPLVPAP